MRNVPSLETIYRDYSPRGVEFYYVYKALAHPETDGYVTPYTLEERLLHVKAAERTLGSEIPWICDTMSNDIKHALGNAPNSEFIVDPEGIIVRRRAWSRPEQLRADLVELVGAVENPTRVADLDLKQIPPPKVAASGVVPRVEVPGRMRPLKIELHASGSPAYVKLRAEAEESFVRNGKGKMYLGFHLDPIYRVHWNNLAAPVRFVLTAPEGITVEPASGEGPKVAAAADIDPREFLVDIDRGDSRSPLTLKVDYFACNDDEGWCKPVTQEYTIYPALDPDGGWVRQRFRRPASGTPRRPPANRPARGPAGEARIGPGQGVMGFVVRVDNETRTLVLRLRSGREQRFQIPADVPIVRNRENVRLSSLQPGDQAMVRFNNDDKSPDGERTVVRVMARNGRE